jgi:hypothetical protein
MVDLSSLQAVDFGGGVTGFQDPSTGTVYDSSGNPLSSSDLAQYGSYTVSGAIGTSSVDTSSQSTFHAPAPAPTVNSPSQGGGGMSGLSGMFAAVGSAFGSVLNPPKTTPGGQPLVFNAATGGYLPAGAAGAGVTNLTQTPMWLVLGLVAVAVAAVFIFAKK